MNSNDQIQKINLTTFKRRLIFVSFFVVMVPLLIITGCARYKDLPPGSVKEIRGSGFQGIELAVLQRTSPFINELASRQFVGGKIIQDGDIASGLTTEKQNEDDKEFSILTPFGHDFFYNISNVLKPNLAGINGKDYAYVPRQYLIGPGDQIRVFFGSPLNKSYSLAVDEHGRVEIPGFGNVFVGGMKFEEMRKHLLSVIGRKAKLDLDISMEPKKTITVFVRGEVRRPMPYAIGAFSTITEALRQIGGPTESGSVRSIEVRRKGITVARFDLYELLIRGIKFRDITLVDGDEIFVPVKGPVVGIDGKVKRPAIYEMKDRFDLESVIALAGGIIPVTDTLRIQVKRLIAGERKTIYDVHDEHINLKSSEPPVLYNGDFVLVSLVPRIAEINDSRVGEDSAEEGKTDLKEEVNKKYIEEPRLMKTVLLTGEFNNPGRYSILDGEKLSSVIERAGGYTSNAYLRGAYFTRESIRHIQQEKLNEIVNRLQRELLPDDSSANATDKIDASFRNMHEETQLKGRFVGYIKSLKPTGRLKINLAHLRLLKASPYDIEMEDLDHLHIPRKTNLVNIVGSVVTEGAHVFGDKQGYREYISAAGGYSRGAEERDIFVVKVDGSTIKLYRGFIEWNDMNNRWEVTPFVPDARIIEAGDVIVVPEKSGHVPWLRQVKDITQIVMNTAATTGILIKFW